MGDSDSATPLPNATGLGTSAGLRKTQPVAAETPCNAEGTQDVVSERKHRRNRPSPSEEDPMPDSFDSKIYAAGSGQQAPAPQDAEIVALSAALKAARVNAPTGPTEADEEALRVYMAENFDTPAEELESLRPSTVTGVLEKVRFHLWLADSVGSDEPYERGLRIAADDLAALAGVPAALNEGDPDAEIKQLWAAAVRLEHEFEHAPFSGTEEERAQQYQHMSEALDKAFAAEAHTVTGLSIKLQQFMKAWELNYEADRQSELISTAYGVAERLAPGSVVYRPNLTLQADQNPDNERDRA